MAQVPSIFSIRETHFKNPSKPSSFDLYKSGILGGRLIKRFYTLLEAETMLRDLILDDGIGCQIKWREYNNLGEEII